MFCCCGVAKVSGDGRLDLWQSASLESMYYSSSPSVGVPKKA